MKNVFLFFLVFLVSFNANAARTDCPAAKIVNIQIEAKKILYKQEGGPWRTLGYLNNEDGTRERYSAILAAQASGRPVMVGYSIDGYDCTETNYGTSAHIVRTYN